MIVRKSPQEIERMARSGDLLSDTLVAIGEAIRPGVTTADLDQLAEEHIRSHGGIPTFKGYRGYPASICASPNAMVVHGIPGPYVLADGDILSVDIGVTLDEFVSDCAFTFAVGSISDEAQRLLDACQQALAAGIAQCRLGNRLSDIGHAIQTVTEAAGFSVIRTLVGHGVGRAMHEDPQIPNYGAPGRGPVLAEGMVFAIEPMITAGDHDVVLHADEWSISSKDGSLAAHFEHTVAVTSTGPRILTRHPGSQLAQSADALEQTPAQQAG
jgi:methionyl aminopeptidase